MKKTIFVNFSILLFIDKSETDWDRWNDQTFKLLLRNYAAADDVEKEIKINLSFAEHAFKSKVFVRNVSAEEWISLKSFILLFLAFLVKCSQ